MKSWKRVATGVFLLLACGWLGLRWAFPPFVPPPIPEPNGYHDIVRAANMLATRTGFYREMDPQELTATVEYNRLALAVAREALTKQFCVPINWSGDPVWMEQVYYPQAQKPREVARGFVVEGLHAIRNGDAKTAIDCGFDCIRLGPLSCHGGLIVDWQVGQACCLNGLMTLRDAIRLLSREECEALKSRLSTLETKFEPPAEIMRHERAFFRARDGALMSAIIEYQVGGVQRREAERMMEVMELKFQVLRKLLDTHLALHMYHLDSNRYPPSLDDLVPNYFESVPLDPFGNGPVVYRLQDDAYALYSLGLNRRDDGGVERCGPDSDIVLDPTPESLQATEDAK